MFYSFSFSSCHHFPLYLYSKKKSSYSSTFTILSLRRSFMRMFFDVKLWMTYKQHLISSANVIVWQVKTIVLSFVYLKINYRIFFHQFSYKLFCFVYLILDNFYNLRLIIQMCGMCAWTKAFDYMIIMWSKRENKTKTNYYIMIYSLIFLPILRCLSFVLTIVFWQHAFLKKLFIFARIFDNILTTKQILLEKDTGFLVEYWLI